MKRRIITLIYLIALSAIFSFKALSQNEFGGVVSFDKTIHNFGVILLSEGEQKCTFTLKNIQDKPIIIHKVISTCGCTEPEWTKSPIMPGKKGEILITFTNDQGPYPFDKSITVYISNLNKPVNLRVRGIVQEKKKSISETYNKKIGSIGMTEDKLDLGQIEQGLSRTEFITIANTSNQSINVKFSNVTAGLSLNLDKSNIPANKTATLTYSVNTKKCEPKKWGKTPFKASVIINGKTEKKQLLVEALIKENFSELSKDERKIGSLPYFEESSYNFGNIAEGKNIEFTLDYKNNGKSDFTIYKIDSSESGVKYEYPESIKKGESAKLKINIDTKGKKGEYLYVITLITNSPLRPLVNILVTGIIK